MSEVRNLNYLTGTRATLVLPQYTETAFTVVKYNVPGISLQPATQQSPLIDLPHAGDKLQFENLNCEFIVTEDLKNWKEIYDRLIHLGTPFSPDQYDGLGVSDAIMTTYSSHNNQIGRFHYFNCVPIYLSGIEVDTREDQTQYKYATVSFAYERFDFIVD